MTTITTWKAPAKAPLGRISDPTRRDRYHPKWKWCSSGAQVRHNSTGWVIVGMGCFASLMLRWLSPHKQRPAAIPLASGWALRPETLALHKSKGTINSQVQRGSAQNVPCTADADRRGDFSLERENTGALLLCFFGTILWPPVQYLDFPPLGLIALGFTATCASALHNAQGVHYHNQTAPCVLEEARVGTSGCVASCRPTFLSPGSNLGVLAKSQPRTLPRLRHQCSVCTVQLTFGALRKAECVVDATCASPLFPPSHCPN
jgi:hypothetical protein